MSKEQDVREALGKGGLVGGTATAGAVVGSLICPGVGTVIGLAIGALGGVGTVAASEAEKQKKKLGKW